MTTTQQLLLVILVLLCLILAKLWTDADLPDLLLFVIAGALGLYFGYLAKHWQ